jgi:hypothetical protein
VVASQLDQTSTLLVSITLVTLLLSFRRACRRCLVAHHDPSRSVFLDAGACEHLAQLAVCQTR